MFEHGCQIGTPDVDCGPDDRPRHRVIRPNGRARPFGRRASKSRPWWAIWRRNLSGIRVIQAFAQESASQERFERVNRASRNVTIRAVSLSFIFLPAVEFLGILSMVIVLGFGGRWWNGAR